MSKFNVGDKVVAQDDAPYYITTDGWEGEVVGIMDTTIQVRGPGMGGTDIVSYWVNPEYFDPKNGFVAFGELTDAEQGALLLAAHNGYDIQFRWDCSERWTRAEDPAFTPTAQYRVAPDVLAERQAVTAAKDALAENEAKIKALEEELASLNI